MEHVWETLTGDLRLALFAVGALFLAVLLVWEFVQRRRARRAEETHIAGAYGQSRHGSGPSRDPLLEGRSAGDAAGSCEDAAASWSDDGFVDGVLANLGIPVRLGDLVTAERAVNAAIRLLPFVVTEVTHAAHASRRGILMVFLQRGR